MTLAEFIKARLDEDEILAYGVLDCCRDSTKPWPPEQVPGQGGPVLTEFLRHFSEHRRLREVELHRMTLARHRTAAGWGPGNWPRELLLLAALWSDHPAYDPAWKPEGSTS